MATSASMVNVHTPCVGSTNRKINRLLPVASSSRKLSMITSVRSNTKLYTSVLRSLPVIRLMVSPPGVRSVIRYRFGPSAQTSIKNPFSSSPTRISTLCGSMLVSPCTWCPAAPSLPPQTTIALLLLWDTIFRYRSRIEEPVWLP